MHLLSFCCFGFWGLMNQIEKESRKLVSVTVLYAPVVFVMQHCLAPRWFSMRVVYVLQ